MQYFFFRLELCSTTAVLGEHLQIPNSAWTEWVYNRLEFHLENYTCTPTLFFFLLGAIQIQSLDRSCAELIGGLLQPLAPSCAISLYAVSDSHLISAHIISYRHRKTGIWLASQRRRGRSRAGTRNHTHSLSPGGHNTTTEDCSTIHTTHGHLIPEEETETARWNTTPSRSLF